MTQANGTARQTMTEVEALRAEIAHLKAALDAAEGRVTVKPRCAECTCTDGNCNWIKTTAPSDKIAEAVREARGLMHDIMCLPDDAKMNVARVWAASARAALSALETP